MLAAGVFTLLQFRDYSSLTLIGIASFLALGACVLPLRGGRLVGLLEWRPLATIGIASYSLYIWHDPIVIWLGGLPGIPQGCAAQVVIAGSLCVAVALISYQLIEVPFLKLRRPWVGPAEPVPDAELPSAEPPVALVGIAPVTFYI